MKTRILIVEDSPLVTDAFSVLFTEAGYDVDVAGTVADAVRRGTDKPVDVMLLDLSLPDGDGLEIMEALRERACLPRATLAMTGHSDAKSRRSSSNDSSASSASSSFRMLAKRCRGETAASTWTGASNRV